MRLLRSVGAVLAGVAVNVVLALATDRAMVAIGLYPPLTEPKAFTTPLLLLATAYRTVYGTLGAYLTAALAPDRPMGHALALGGAGLIASLAGAVAMWNFGPNWYPLALVGVAISTAWGGGKLRLMQVPQRG